MLEEVRADSATRSLDLRMTEQDLYDITVENRAKRDLAHLAK